MGMPRIIRKLATIVVSDPNTNASAWPRNSPDPSRTVLMTSPNPTTNTRYTYTPRSAPTGPIVAETTVPAGIVVCMTSPVSGDQVGTDTYRSVPTTSGADTTPSLRTLNHRSRPV